MTIQEDQGHILRGNKAAEPLHQYSNQLESQPETYVDDAISGVSSGLGLVGQAQDIQNKRAQVNQGQERNNLARQELLMSERARVQKLAFEQDAFNQKLEVERAEASARQAGYDLRTKVMQDRMNLSAMYEDTRAKKVLNDTAQLEFERQKWEFEKTRKASQDEVAAAKTGNQIFENMVTDKDGKPHMVTLDAAGKVTYKPIDPQVAAKIAARRAREQTLENEELRIKRITAEASQTRAEGQGGLFPGVGGGEYVRPDDAMPEKAIAGVVDSYLDTTASRQLELLARDFGVRGTDPVKRALTQLVVQHHPSKNPAEVRDAIQGAIRKLHEGDEKLRAWFQNYIQTTTPSEK